MKKILALILFLLSYLGASFDDLFNQQDDPCLYHHVNILSGALNLNFIDAKILGEVPITIFRSYSSQGGLERNKIGFDLLLKELRGGFIIQGGWDFFSFTNLLINQSSNGSVKAYLSEPGGGMINYSTYKVVNRNKYILKPVSKQAKCFGKISAITNIQNYRLNLNIDEGIAVLQLPNGGKRTYFRVIHQIKNKEIKLENVYYRLVEEILPSGHIVDYFYDKFTRLERIETKSPDRKQCYAFLDFNLLKTKAPMNFKLRSSDGRIFSYSGLEFEERDYLSYKKTDNQAAIKILYEPGRKNTGAFLKEIFQGERLLFSVDYYRPKNALIERMIDKDESKKDFQCDKVKTLFFPDPHSGEKIAFANFSYKPGCTEVENHEGVITKYYHDDGKLNKIDYFNRDGKINSSMKFIWDDCYLRAKLLLDNNGLAVISKVFLYDEFGNVIQEIVYGDLTGEKEAPFNYNCDGSLNNSDSYTKKYQYEYKFNRLILEIEEDGLEYEYYYLNNTSLLEKKITKKEDKIILREFYLYDKNNLLIEEIVDDGDYKTICQKKRFIRDKKSGVINQQIEEFFDPILNKFFQTKRIVNFYNENKRLTEFHIYDAEDKFISSENIFYDLSGKIIKKENNSGEEWLYEYDDYENLIKQKEVGNSEKIIQYDYLRRPTKVQLSTNNKFHETVYDIKGNPILKINELGQKTQQKFDEFGNCLEAFLPETIDQDGNSYIPKIKYIYDCKGNIQKVIDPLKNVIQICHTLYRNPKKIIQKDGTVTSNFYYKNGLLKKTVNSDLSYIIREYDSFSRLKKEILYSYKDEILAEEIFEYTTFFLKYSKDKNGLETNYKYDFKGQLIEKISGGRKIKFIYDSFQRVVKEIYSSYQKCISYNTLGLPCKTMEINSSGKITNKKKYFYDKERRLIKIVSQLPFGKVYELFGYDEENRIIFYQDPSGSVINVDYQEIFNDDLGYILQKKTKNQLNQIKIEVYDPLNRLILIELQDDSGNIFGKTEFFYDRLGCQSKVVSHIFEKNQFKKKKSYRFFYDSMGRKISEYDENQFIRSFSYDLLGNLSSITFPSGKKINYQFDSLKRLKQISTVDNCINYSYEYKQGFYPSLLYDHIQKTKIERKYNFFGDLIEESDCNKFYSKWDYDEEGRLIYYQYPDNSFIKYTYKDQFLDEISFFENHDLLKISHKFVSYDNVGNLELENYDFDFGLNYYRYDNFKRPISNYNTHFNQNASFNLLGQLESYQNSYEKNKIINYDPLGQIEKEGDNYYLFDSNGNPTNAVYNQKDELVNKDGWSISYDQDGNIIEKKNDKETISYSYDSMNRLSKIKNRFDEIDLIYDPLSRLIEKKINGVKQFFIYDGENEIASVIGNKITEMKILHPNKNIILYVKLGNNFFIPQTDFNGNIRSVFNICGDLIESIAMDSFGNCKNKINHIIPWTFSGKRKIGNLLVFPSRFYDPELGRWISRDPLGYLDGYNLYAFVCNRPSHRFDELGLYSKDYFPCDIKINVPIQLLVDAGESKGVISANGFIGSANVDWVISCGRFHELQFRADEIESGQVNIMEHFSELIPKDGKLVGLITAQNGINTTFEEFKEFNRGLVEKSPGDILVIGLHNPTQGVLNDLKRVLLESTFIETAAVTKTRQFLEAISYSIHQINSELLWSHIVHSEAGIITKRALENMHPEAKDKVKEQLKIFALGPASPISNKMALEVENIYSNRDFITGGMGIIYSFGENYNITFEKCISNLKERNLFFIDHAFLGSTYQTALANKFLNEMNNNKCVIHR